MKNKQTGAALMVSLVLIFMMSVMGISAMRSANLDKRMSTNAVHKSRTFQAAESITELALDDRGALGKALTSGGVVMSDVKLNTDENLKTKVTLEFTGMGMVSGWSTTFMGPQFQVVGTGEIENVYAKTRIVQGAYVPAPAN